MRREFREEIEIPEGIECTYENNVLTCKKDGVQASKKMFAPRINVSIEGGKIVFLSKKANKVEKSTISTFLAHTRNLFAGIQEKYEYELESASIHFPMTLKTEGSELVINNFLGEKIARKAKILPDTEVNVDGQKIIVSSHNRESAGQTAANIEQATQVTGRDRRIFQDGIFIVKKPGRRIE